MAKHKLCFTTEYETPTLQLSVSLSGSKRDLETSSMSLTDGCHWRLEYVRIVAFSGSLHCSFIFIRYPIVRISYCYEIDIPSNSGFKASSC